MKLAGLTPCSFVDDPDHLAAVVFTPGCNMRCFYCHNASIACKTNDAGPDVSDVFDLLRRRKGMLESVVISGGEPTLQDGLGDFCARVKDLGYRVKLDTNGTNPDVLAGLIARREVDYVAMDVKAPQGRYERICRKAVDVRAVEESVLQLLTGRVGYEFRTTFAPPLRSSDVCRIATWIAGARRYVLQQYKPQLAQRPAPLAHTDAYVLHAAALVKPFVEEVCLRGLDAGTYVPREPRRPAPLAETA
jgi:pyruvate formate lyase activating enzyme